MTTPSLAPNAAQRFAAFCANVARRDQPHLSPLAAAPSIVSTEGNGAEGGYLVPVELRDDLVATLLGEDSLLRHAFLIPTPTNSAWLPVDPAPPWTASGVTSRWEGEPPIDAPADHATKPALASVQQRLQKQTVFVPMTSELYEDAPSAGVYIASVVRERMLFKVNDAILNGTGIGQPTGILNSDALIVQAKEAAQPAATVVAANIKKMWTRMYAPSRRRAVWIANVDVEPFLDDLAFPMYVPAGAAGNALPLLKGRPVVFTEASPALGTKGDLVLADLGSYAAAVRVRGAVNPDAAPGDPDLIKSELSMHVWFDQDMAALRFTMRMAGRGIWNAPIARTKGQQSVSTFVALADRS